MRKRMALGATVLAVLAAVLVVSSPAGASCPGGKAGRLRTEFHKGLDADYAFWRNDVPTTIFSSSQRAEVEFALMHPADSSVTLYVSDGSSNFVAPTFSNGFAAGVNYALDKWNNVRIALDFNADTFVLTINGVSSEPQPFANPSTQIEEINFEISNKTASSVDVWLDSARLTKVTSGGSEIRFQEMFADDTPPMADFGTLSQLSPPTTEAGAGANCPTKTTLNIDKSASQIEAKGKVTPRHPGEEVAVKLLKKVGEDFELVRRKTDALDAESRYLVTFGRPNANRCRIIVRFLADSDHLSSGRAETFDC